MERSDLFYVRFIDDMLLLAPTRWKLRGGVKVLNEVLGGLRLEKHPDKTFIGKIEKGFDFRGSRFSPADLTVAQGTVRKFVERATQLYEQEQGKSDRDSLLGVYVRRWVGWAQGGGVRPIPPTMPRLGCETSGDLWARDRVTPSQYAQAQQPEQK